MMVQFDEKLGIIRSSITGVQTVQEGQAYMAALREQALIAQARVGRVLHFVDGRATMVQPNSTAEAYMSYDMGGLRFDKVATVLTSALLKMQTRRVYSETATVIFDDPDEALTWLLSDETTAPN